MSKNNPANRGQKASGYRVTGSGKLVLPVLYLGRALGHGKYMAAGIDSELVRDNAGKPLAYRDLTPSVLAAL